MTRAAVSVPSNIAEGYERGSNPEFIRYLNIARGSVAELRTQLYIAAEVGVISKDDMAEMVEEARIISAMLTRLAQARKSTVGEVDELPGVGVLNEEVG